MRSLNYYVGRDRGLTMVRGGFLRFVALVVPSVAAGQDRALGSNVENSAAKKEHQMVDEQKSFKDLVSEAPVAPTAGTVSLVGTLARSSEAGKFVLTLPGGNAVTLETASVKSHAVLGTSVGHTIVRIDVDAGQIPAETLLKAPLETAGAATVAKQGGEGTGPKMPFHETGVANPVGIPALYGWSPVQAGGFIPFTLAIPHQVPVSTLAAVQGLAPAALLNWYRGGGGVT
jgi:hypothetical protein